ncbi:SpoIIE family protein phosphatase [Gemmatimonadota bacterium]
MSRERTPGREPDAGSPDLNNDPLPYQLALKNRALASSAEGITISDVRLPDNPLIYANRGFEEITGYSREESIGRNCRFLQGSDTEEESLNEIRSAIAGERPCVVELLNYRKDGTPFWNRLSLTPLKDETGLVTHFIGVQSDVTRRRLAEDALQEANKRLESINQRMRRDLDTAASIQKSLLPDNLPEVEGVSFSWFLESCDELAGDTLNVIPLDEDHLGLYVLDVSGHGVPAALLSVTLHRWLSHDPDHSLLRSAGSDPGYGLTITPPAEVAERLNRQFPLDPAVGQYFTMIYGILNLSTSEFRYVTAGHPSLIHVPADGAPHQPESASTPIGFLADAEYENESMTLKPGDRLYLFSDGLTELQNEGGDFMGVDRLLSMVGSHRSRGLEESIRGVIGDARNWSGNRPLEDDLTLLGIEIA